MLVCHVLDHFEADHYVARRVFTARQVESRRAKKAYVAPAVVCGAVGDGGTIDVYADHARGGVAQEFGAIPRAATHVNNVSSYSQRLGQQIPVDVLVQRRHVCAPRDTALACVRQNTRIVRSVHLAATIMTDEASYETRWRGRDCQATAMRIDGWRACLLGGRVVAS